MGLKILEHCQWFSPSKVLFLLVLRWWWVGSQYLDWPPHVLYIEICFNYMLMMFSSIGFRTLKVKLCDGLIFNIWPTVVCAQTIYPKYAPRWSIWKRNYPDRRPCCYCVSLIIIFCLQSFNIPLSKLRAVGYLDELKCLVYSESLMLL